MGVSPNDCFDPVENRVVTPRSGLRSDKQKCGKYMRVCFLGIV